MLKFKQRVSSLINRVLADDNVNSQTNLFVNGLNRIYTSCFPMKSKFISVKQICKPWLTSAILRSVKTKAYYFKMSKLGVIISAELNRLYTNKLKAVIRQTKQNYFRDVFLNCKNDIKTWKTIRTLLSRKPTNKKIKSVLINGEVVTECNDIAEAFSEYFANIACSLETNLPHTDECPLTHVPQNMLSSFFLNLKSKIVHIIRNSKITSSNTNEIPVRIIRQIADIIADTLTCLINRSFRERVFPDILKVAKIVPIFKAGDPQCISNYRPISILPTFSKIFE